METQNIMEEIRGSLDTILNFSGLDQEFCDNFRDAIAAYKKLSDKNGSDDQAASLRRKLTDLFYKVYKACFVLSVRNKTLPPVISMFLNFGYVDEELAGEENAAYMYELAGALPTDPERGVYSIYQWLMAILRGEKEPSRNELDMDYREHLADQKKNGIINAEQEANLAQNNAAKTIFELENILPTINRLTFGQITIFCPIFSRHNVFKPLKSAIVTADKVTEEFTQIRKIDFKAFYRETLYSDTEKGINERIEVEVLPDLILMPNVGSRSIMWQEIEGKKRTTPARMMCSIFHMEELTQSLIHLTGEFRWEMCKRVQGGRWNDVSEPSLTSEYCDYIQFYRRNKELSAEAKEKIKNQLGRVRNSFKEMFVTDYIMWMRYESGGSPRLNKVSRNILFSYCPFSREIRNRVGVNPLYGPAIEKYNIMNSKNLHKMEILCKRLEKLPDGIPDEILEYKSYMES